MAPIKLGPFMPAVLGTRQLGNFTVSSYPLGGSACLAVFACGLAGLCAHYLAGVHRDLPNS